MAIKARDKVKETVVVVVVTAAAAAAVDDISISLRIPSIKHSGNDNRNKSNDENKSIRKLSVAFVAQQSCLLVLSFSLSLSLFFLSFFLVFVKGWMCRSTPD